MREIILNTQEENILFADNIGSGSFQNLIK